MFTVVMATYNRGRHILPSIRSVLGQTCSGFELIVVGDHCTDDTAEVVASVGSDRISWINLPLRGSSQSYPNNEGIERARGDVIAYLGHDDIWAADHLERLAGVFAGDPSLDFAVSGCVFHMPPGIDRPQVTGIFAESDAALEHFFPPSSIAHRRDVTSRIGRWADPFEIAAPVDVDFQLRAARAAMRFASTGQITVHKFAAGHRYLSYLVQDSAEQDAMLARLSSPGAADYVAQLLALSKAEGEFMTKYHPNVSNHVPGQMARENAARKGLSQPPPRVLERTALIQPEQGNFALDWAKTPHNGIRWVGPNPRPKILVNYTGAGAVKVLMELAHKSPDGLREIKLSGPGVGAVALSRPFKSELGWHAVASFEMELSSERASIIVLDLQGPQVKAPRRRGIGIGDIVLLPPGSEGLVEHLVLGIAAEQKRSRALTKSRSWRLTAGLRYASALLRRLAGWAGKKQGRPKRP